MKYKRVLIKLSGEYLSGDNKLGIDSLVIQNICKSIKEAHDLGCHIAIVVGGGNFWRGRDAEKMSRVKADYVGMLGTVMNSLILCDYLEKFGLKVRVQTSIDILKFAEPFAIDRALKHLNKGRIVIFSGGTGNPFFSTDTAASLRAIEIGADIILKATMVDGIFDCDPKTNQNAVKYDSISFDEILSLNLSVIDSTSAAMCRDNRMKILVFNLNDTDNIIRAVKGEKIGTIVN